MERLERLIFLPQGGEGYSPTCLSCGNIPAAECPASCGCGHPHPPTTETAAEAVCLCGKDLPTRVVGWESVAEAPYGVIIR